MPPASINHVKLHVPSVSVVIVFDFVLENFVALDQGRQLGDVEALLFHCQVLRRGVVPDGQVSLALL